MSHFMYQDVINLVMCFPSGEVQVYV